MMFIGGRNGFLTKLQESGQARVTITASDDVVIVAQTIQACATELGIGRVHIFVESIDVLVAVAEGPEL